MRVSPSPVQPFRSVNHYDLVTFVGDAAAVGCRVGAQLVELLACVVLVVGRGPDAAVAVWQPEPEPPFGVRRDVQPVRGHRGSPTFPCRSAAGTAPPRP